MTWIKQLDKNSLVPVYKQIVEQVLSALDREDLKVGDAISSINRICREMKLAPGTVIRAYDELKELGILRSRQGKGYFIYSSVVTNKTKVLLLFDRMNNYKEILYDSFLSGLNKGTEVNVFFHHYDIKRFEKLIRENAGRYSHYVVMPHFNRDVSHILNKIPEKKLILIDSIVDSPGRKPNAVYQNFENNIYTALLRNRNAFQSYEKIWLSLSESVFQFVPEGCKTGFDKACNEMKMPHEIIRKVDEDALEKHHVYIVFSDKELVYILKAIDRRTWKLGVDIGIISYDDTPVKEVLSGGVSTMSTDFTQMGISAAKMVNGNLEGQISNPFQLIRRSSF